MRKLRLFLLISIISLVACLALGVASFTAYAETTHSVKFYSDYTMSSECALEQNVTDGKYALMPETPEEDGKVFLYWANAANGARFSFNTAVKGDLDLYACWLDLNPVTMYTVDFRVDGITVNTQNVKSGEAAIAPTSIILPTGKSFVEWDGDFDTVTEDLVINAVLEDSKYTVFVFGLNDKLVDTLVVTHGQSVDIGSLDTYEEHYVEEHYVLDEEDATAALANITGSKDVYLKYTPEVYDVTFYRDGVQFGAVQNVSYGSLARFPEIPQKEGYIFVGWYDDIDSDTGYSFVTPVTGNVDLYAKYIAIQNKKYSVKFFNYDLTQYGGTQMVEEGQTPIVPGTPQRDGYTFVGWCVEGDVDDIFDFEEGIYEDVNVYAMFDICTYTVRFYDGEELISEQEVNYGQNAVAPEVSDKEGYVFVGFDTGYKKIKGDTVVHTVYKARTYAVMFYDYNFKKIGATQYVEYGKSAVAPNPPKREGYTFLRWEPAFDEVGEDISVFPVYEKIIVTYTFISDEDLFYAEFEYGDKAEMPSIEKKGYIFTGWYEGDVLYDFNTVVTKERTLTASWTLQPPTTYNVTFMNGASVYNVQVVEEGRSAIAPADPYKKGHTFTGWDKEFNNVSEELIVNAVFKKNVYTVTFIVDGNKTTEDVEFNATVSQPERPEKTGYSFGYWETTRGVEYDFDTPVEGNITLKAVFIPENYTVTFIVNGETYGVQNVPYGGYASVPATPIVYGKSFAGWFVGKNVFAFTAPITADVEVEAKFNVNKFCIYYYLNGKSYQTQEYAYGDEVVALAAPDYDEYSYEFSGWQGLPETMPAESITVSATLTEIVRYTLTYYVNGAVYTQKEYKVGELVNAVAEPQSANWKFVSWIGEPTYMPADNVKVIAEIKRYYTINYYVENVLYTSQKVLEGEAVTASAIPESEDWVFDCWQGVPDTMPAADVEVNAVVKYYYVISFYVGDQVVYTDKLLAGDAVPEIADPTSEDFEFVKWIGLPTVMPAKNVSVSSEVKYYYTVTFIVDGEVYEVQKVLEGDRIELPKAPQSEYWEFNGWQGVPTVMPSENVEVTASITMFDFYTVTYVVNGKEFATQTYKAGDRISSADNPSNTEDYVFVEWSKLPDTMPEEDLTATAVLKYYYNVYYQVNGEVFTSSRVLEGSAVHVVGAPYIEGKTFVKWIGFAEGMTMPQNDLTLVAEYVDEALPALVNDFVVIETEDGLYQLRVEGDVCVGGFIGYIWVDGLEDAWVIDASCSDVYIVDGTLRFIWSQGQNATEEFTVLCFKATPESFVQTMIAEIYLFNEKGTVVSAEYHIEK